MAVVIYADDPNAEADLSTYRSYYGLSSCTRAGGCFRKVNESGVEGSYPAASVEVSEETSLDLDMVSATCPNCHIILIESRQENLRSAVHSAPSFGANVISNSWGYTTEEPNETAEDREFQLAGVPITFATGDRAGVTEYPAASPYVIAVGGTTLERAENTRGWTESAWSNTTAACSAYEPKPAWQTDSGCPRRTYADVSAVAENVSFYDSYGKSGWLGASGTSVASPIVAGTLALTEATTRALGAAAFYGDPSSLFDVTTGRAGTCGTYICNAGPGYDAPTGLGTPDGVPLVTASAAAGTSPTIVRDESTGSQYIYYVDRATYGLAYWAWTPSTGWVRATLGGSIAAGTSPTVVRDPSTGSQYVYYVDRATNGLAYWAWTPSTGWVRATLGGSIAAGTSPTMVRDASTGFQYIYYVDRATNGIAYWAWNSIHGWSNGVLGGAAAAGTSPTFVRDASTGAEYVYYVDRATNGLAYWAWRRPPTGWVDAVLGGSIAAGSSPTVVRDTSTGSQYVYYVDRATNGLAYWALNPSTGWVTGVLGGSIAAGTSPTIVRDASTGSQYVYYVDRATNGLAYWAWTPSTGWVRATLGGSIAAGTSPTMVRDASTGYQYIYYVDRATNGIGYWAWDPINGWTNAVL